MHMKKIYSKLFIIFLLFLSYSNVVMPHYLKVQAKDFNASIAHYLTSIDGELYIDGEKSKTIQNEAMPRKGYVLSTGDYILSSDIVLNNNLALFEDYYINIDLNGYTLDLGENYIFSNYAQDFSIYDNSILKNGKITSSNKCTIEQGSFSKTFNLYGGTIENTYICDGIDYNYSALTLYGNVNLHDGCMKSNTNGILYTAYINNKISLGNVKIETNEGFSDIISINNIASNSIATDPAVPIISLKCLDTYYEDELKVKSAVDINTYSENNIDLDNYVLMENIKEASKIKVSTYHRELEYIYNEEIYDSYYKLIPRPTYPIYLSESNLIEVHNYKLTTSPSYKNNYTIEFNYMKGLSFQWYERERGTENLTLLENETSNRITNPINNKRYRCIITVDNNGYQFVINTLYSDECNHNGTLGKWNEPIGFCTLEGVKGYYYCSACGEYLDKDLNVLDSLVLEPLGHDIRWREGKEATCKESGKIPHYYCSRCSLRLDENYNEISSVVIPKGHHGGVASCSSKATCFTCGVKYGEIDPNFHIPEFKWYSNLSKHWMKCKDCDVKIDVEDHIDKNMNGLCDICDKVCYSPLLLIVSITSIGALGALLYFLRKRYYF